MSALHRGVLVRKRADHVVNFIQGLTLSTDGIEPWCGQPFMLRDWQEQIVRELFGRVRADDKTRRSYRVGFIGVPRKNGKTELAAALALYGLIADGVQRAQVYSAAAEKQQAAQVFNAAAAMVEQDPELRARIDIQATQKRMVDKVTRSFYQAISAEAYSKHGFNASLVIYDELHAAPSRDLWDVLRTSMGARREPLMIAITTAGFDTASICYELWDYARKVRDGVIDDPSFYQCLYETAPGADWLDEDVWRAANPALQGAHPFRDIDEMRDFARVSQRSAEAQGTFRRLYLNQWTTSEVRWLDMHDWKQCAHASASEARGLVTYCGLDLGLKSDLSAMVGVTPLADGRYLVRCCIWLPEGARERYHSRPYDSWQEADALRITPGPVTDFGQIVADITQLCDDWNVSEIAYDERFAEPVMQQLQVPQVLLIQQPQGYALNLGLRTLEDAVLNHTLAHNDQPVLAWMAANAIVESGPRGEVAINKRKNREKIDAVVALAMALQRAVLQASAGSAYEDPNYSMEAGTW